MADNRWLPWGVRTEAVKSRHQVGTDCMVHVLCLKLIINPIWHGTGEVGEGARYFLNSLIFHEGYHLSTIFGDKTQPFCREYLPLGPPKNIFIKIMKERKGNFLHKDDWPGLHKCKHREQGPPMARAEFSFHSITS